MSCVVVTTLNLDSQSPHTHTQQPKMCQISLKSQFQLNREIYTCKHRVTGKQTNNVKYALFTFCFFMWKNIDFCSFKREMVTTLTLY